MLLSIAKLAASTRYHVRDTQRYYVETEPGERPGRFLGSGAMALGLPRFVDAKSFASLMEGVHPFTGEKLVQNAGRPNRRGGFDHVMSATKSVSVLYGLGNEAEKRAIRLAIWKTAQFAVEKVDAVCYTRRGSNGTPVKASPVIAAFFQVTTRAGDPHVHAHLVVFNVGVTADGHWGAIEMRPLVEQKMALGALLKAEFDYQLQRALPGLPFMAGKHGVEIGGISDAVTRHFSKRRQQIEAELDRMVASSAKAAELATLKTRPRKTRLPAFTELQKRWRHEALQLGFCPDLFRRTWHNALTSESQREPITARAISREVRRALTRGLEVREDAVVQQVAQTLGNGGISGRRLSLGIERVVQHSPSISMVGTGRFGKRRYTSAEMERISSVAVAVGVRLSESQGRQHVTMARMLARAQVIKCRVFMQWLNRRRDKSLTSEARKGIELVMKSKRQLAVLEIKTYENYAPMIRQLSNYYQAADYHVVVATRGRRACEIPGFMKSVDRRTTASLLTRIRAYRSYRQAAKHAAKQLVREAVGRYIGLYPGNRRPLMTPKSVIIVTDAHALAPADMHDLVREAKRCRSKLILVGAVSTEATTTFSNLAASIESIKVHRVLRGRPSAGLNQRDANVLRRWHHCKSEADALQKITKPSGQPSRPPIIVVDSAADVRRVHRALQADDVTNEGRVRTATGDWIGVGDRIRWTRTDKVTGIPAGDFGRVESVSTLLGLVRVELENGQLFSLPARRLRACLAHAVTPEAAPKCGADLMVVARHDKLNSVIDRLPADSLDRSEFFVVGGEAHLGRSNVEILRDTTPRTNEPRIER